MPRSALGGGVTTVVAVTLLFAGTVSDASLLPLIVFVREPETAVTFTTMVNDADPALARDAIEQLMVWLVLPNCARPALRTMLNVDVVSPRLAAVQVNEAPCPTASEGHVHPAGTVIDCQSSVLLRMTDIVALVAASGPALVTLTV